jgi:hypothetical protein
LLAHAANVTSQSGEDGIIAKILEVLGEPIGWCVEFGAWDGRYLSNTYDLIARRGFSAVLIEGSERRFRDLVDRFTSNPKIVPLNAFVGFSADDGLDTLLAKTPIPEEFDVLSIDIDGNDYHVWKAVTRYRPRLVVIEYNPTIPTEVAFVQPADLRVNQGSSLRALTELARDKGYELVAVTLHNALFVRSDHFAAFGIADNSPAALRPDESMVTYIFNGIDGTVFIRGYGRLGWHGIPYRERRMQLVGRPFRRFPDTFGPVMKKLAKAYRSLRKRGLL